MARRAGTDMWNRGFGGLVVVAVWQKAAVVPGLDPAAWRKDQCGAFIAWREYGNTNSSNGWEIDHIVPVAKGGSDSLANLQPLQWENNRSKGDSYPQWFCRVSAA